MVILEQHTRLVIAPVQFYFYSNKVIDTGDFTGIIFYHGLILNIWVKHEDSLALVFRTMQLGSDFLPRFKPDLNVSNM